MVVGMMFISLIFIKLNTTTRPAEYEFSNEKDYLETQSIPSFEYKKKQPEVNREISVIINKLIACESGGNEKALGDNGKAFGILQFHQGTFDRFGELYGLPHDNIWDKKQQIDIAEKMIKDGLEYHWTCSRLISVDR